MSFYSDPAFFILAAVVAVPAFVLGMLEKPLHRYGLVASVLFMVLLFGQDLYGAASFVFFLVWSSALTLIVQKLFKSEHKHAVAWYRVCLALLIVPLCAVKVLQVFDCNLIGFIGISYITFKSAQVLIEIRDGLIEEMGYLDYLYFLVFFPSFTSGPITRSREFIEQSRTVSSRAEYLDLAASGVLRFAWGLVYMFVIAAFLQWLMWFAPSAIDQPVLSEIIQAFCYGLYLFFDFAGYSLMAIGLGAFLGTKVPRNFRAPFLSVDIKDFWNRWHLTLSYWLRDYVFMRMMRPLIRAKVFKSRTTVACWGYIAQMTLMGVWHGLTVSYIAYGVYHGLLLAGCELFQKTKFYKNYKKARWFKVCSWAITMVAVFFGFALFSGQVYDCMMGVSNG